jgi:hypothetical protein
MPAGLKRHYRKEGYEIDFMDFPDSWPWILVRVDRHWTMVSPQPNRNGLGRAPIHFAKHRCDLDDIHHTPI